jgi:hypothetical protein
MVNRPVPGHKGNFAMTQGAEKCISQPNALQMQWQQLQLEAINAILSGSTSN